MCLCDFWTRVKSWFKRQIKKIKDFYEKIRSKVCGPRKPGGGPDGPSGPDVPSAAEGTLL